MISESALIYLFVIVAIVGVIVWAASESRIKTWWCNRHHRDDDQ